MQSTAPTAREVQDELWVDLFNHGPWQEGDSVIFYGSREDFNAWVQATHARYPQFPGDPKRPLLGVLFKWRSPVTSRSLPYLEAAGPGWARLREVHGVAATVEVKAVFHHFQRELTLKLNLVEPEREESLVSPWRRKVRRWWRQLRKYLDRRGEKRLSNPS